jgi:hypothetical protein
MNGKHTARWLIKIVKDEYRIRIPLEIADIVDWLKAEEEFSIQCAAFLGAYEEVQIASSVPGAETLNELSSELAGAAFRPQNSSTPVTQLARFVSTAWSVRCSFELPKNRHAKGRFTLYLPTELADLGILPPSNERIMAFAAGSFIELWKPDAWLQNVRSVRADLERMIGSATEQLEELS